MTSSEFLRAGFQHRKKEFVDEGLKNSDRGRVEGVFYIARRKMSSKGGQKEKPRPAINTGNKNKGGLGTKTCSGEGPNEKGLGWGRLKGMKLACL